jgi:hypothetical protein
MQPTALVHEVYLRLGGVRNMDWKGRAHFISLLSPTGLGVRSYKIHGEVTVTRLLIKRQNPLSVMTDS